MTRFPLGFSFLFFLSFSPLCSAQLPQTIPVSEKHPEFAEKIHIDGVKDAGKLNAYLYRGTQPTNKGLHSLKKLGVTMIIDLRGEFRRESSHERREAESLGMKFVLLPGNGWSPPTDKQMAEFFSLISERPERKIFIHCWLGGDRTGVFLAAYRIAFDHWSSQHALEEMHAFHFKSFWHPAMKKYVRTFSKRLATSPTLAPYRHFHESAVAQLWRDPVLLSTGGAVQFSPARKRWDTIVLETRAL
jgi:tyrosine-protein phosphatase SIW14